MESASLILELVDVKKAFASLGQAGELICDVSWGVV